MARLARVVLPDYPHHIVQRGVRSMDIFFSPNDYDVYLQILKEQSQRFGLDILSYCLMTNHIHIIAVPNEENSLAKAIGETHRLYTRMINFRQKTRGYLFQGRFFSTVLSESYFMAALRYVERNPLKAHMVENAWDYKYSSAPYRVGVIKENIILKSHPLIKSIVDYKKFLQTGFMSMDPKNGHIKAWVGGIDFKHFKYDHVMQGRRQPGSTFKPFVYNAAIDQGYSPCYTIEDAPVTFSLPGQQPPTYTPKNFNLKFTGEKYTLRRGMSNSKNSITAFVMKEMTTPATVVKYAKELGVENPLEAVPSLCFGTSDVSVYELVGAYSAFVNKGVYTKPYF
ncbi:MAG: transposase, partial [Campylobacteraceae bacterium]|nr:transposase [Campylobacteraceae bacterium]